MLEDLLVESEIRMHLERDEDVIPLLLRSLTRMDRFVLENLGDSTPGFEYDRFDRILAQMCADVFVQIPTDLLSWPIRREGLDGERKVLNPIQTVEVVILWVTGLEAVHVPSVTELSHKTGSDAPLVDLGRVVIGVHESEYPPLGDRFDH